MVQNPIRSMTLAEFLAMPETKPASEYIDGQIIQKPMPQGQHSIIQRQLLFEIDPVLSNVGIAQAFPELRRNFAGRSIVPDVANVFEIALDWTIEILSPGQSTTKVLRNIKHCVAHGTKMGWLIDPEDRSIIVIGTGQIFDAIDEPSAIFPVPEFARSIQLNIGDIFGWLQKKRPTTFVQK
jgi:Uma2 family endonuclease